MTISESVLLAKYAGAGYPPFAFDPDRACRNVADKELFFPERDGRHTGDEAKAICEECPLKAECREWAIEAPEKHGIWGGLTEHQRVPIRKKREAERAARGGAAAA